MSLRIGKTPCLRARYLLGQALVRPGRVGGFATKLFSVAERAWRGSLQVEAAHDERPQTGERAWARSPGPGANPQGDKRAGLLESLSCPSTRNPANPAFGRWRNDLLFSRRPERVGFERLAQPEPGVVFQLFQQRSDGCQQPLVFGAEQHAHQANDGQPFTQRHRASQRSSMSRRSAWISQASAMASLSPGSSSRSKRAKRIWSVGTTHFKKPGRRGWNRNNSLSTAGGTRTSPNKRGRSDSCPMLRRFDRQEVSLTTIIARPLQQRPGDRKRGLRRCNSPGCGGGPARAETPAPKGLPPPPPCPGSRARWNTCPPPGPTAPVGGQAAPRPGLATKHSHFVSSAEAAHLQS